MDRRNIAAATVILGILLLAGACSVREVVKGNGVEATRIRNLPVFHSVEVSHGLQAVITLGAEQSVVLQGDENLLPRVETEVDGDVLLLRPVEDDEQLKPKAGLVVRITIPELRSLEASGSARIRAEGVSAEELALVSSGGASIQVTNLNVPVLDAEVSGGADLEIQGLRGSHAELVVSGGAEARASGQVTELSVQISGGADLDAGDLKANRVDMEGSGGASLRVRATEEIGGSLTGGARGCYFGGPEKVRVSTSGGASVKPCS